MLTCHNYIGLSSTCSIGAKTNGHTHDDDSAALPPPFDAEFALQALIRKWPFVAFCSTALKNQISDVLTDVG